jgi:hypothetical protein
MNRSSRLLAGCAVFIAVLATGSLAPSPAEAHWRPYWRPGFVYPGFYRPAFYPRPFFYPRPVLYPRPIVYRPVYLPPPPPVYAAYVPPPPPVVYSAPARKRVVHRKYRKVSKRPACNCPAQPAAAPAPAAPAQPPAQGS